MQNVEHPFLGMIEQHSALISKICRSFCPDNKEDYDDLRQEMLLNLWRGWKRWRPDHKPVTWVWRVATNTAISWRRSKNRKIQTQPLDGHDIPDNPDNNEAIIHLYSLIGRLPAADQRLIQLYIDGWSGEEIGQMLQITSSNVTTRIGRIKQKLRNLENNESHE